MQFDAPFVKDVGNPTGCEWQTSDPKADQRDLVNPTSRPFGSHSARQSKGNPPVADRANPYNVSPRVQATSRDPKMTATNTAKTAPPLGDSPPRPPVRRKPSPTGAALGTSENRRT